MLAGIFFATTRSLELLFLIPLIGMMSYLVHGYVAENLLTPDYILVLFIVSVLAGVWALFTLLFYFNARRSGHFLALVDLAIFAALIAGVVVLRGIAPASCANLTTFDGYAQLAPFANTWSHTCGVMKASFAFGIINVILFFWSFLFAIWVHDHYRREHPEYSSRPTRVVERYHSSRSGNRRSSSRGSRAVGPPPPRDYDRRGSSRRGTSRGAYSSRRSYV